MIFKDIYMVLELCKWVVWHHNELVLKKDMFHIKGKIVKYSSFHAFF